MQKGSKTGTFDLPLHGGKCPQWLMERMEKLARAIIEAILLESSPEEFLERISHPVWFQSLALLLGFDWHSSGTTTTTCYALKKAINEISGSSGIFSAGGKGRFSRKTPEEILQFCEKEGINPDPLIYASRMSAKVDSALVQDGFTLYHHFFIFTRNGNWAVIQQGMNPEKFIARRYHWLSTNLKSFVREPHLGIVCDEKFSVLNLVAEESEGVRNAIERMFQEGELIEREVERISRKFPSRHYITEEDFNLPHLQKTMRKILERGKYNFESIAGTEGVGPKTMRALTLISECIYGAEPSFRDPVRYSFAHGGKDGHPYPVLRKIYDESIQFLTSAVEKARIGERDKMEALKRLSGFSSP